MPNYSFKCENCKHKFELFLKMAENNKPVSEPCPNCKKKKIIKDWSEQANSVGYDMSLTPLKVYGNAWNDIINKVKKVAPQSMQDRLEQSRTFNAGRLERH
jgi:putative FmdB family regulatory protein